MNKFGFITITGELLTQQLALPKDLVILKILPSAHLSYTFDVVFTTTDERHGRETAEGAEVASMNPRFDI